jgi:capsular polysaccharide biosynthesis protein
VTALEPPSSLSVASPDEILTLARSRHASERFWSSPGSGSDYRSLGQRISWAPELQQNATNGQASVLEMIDAAKEVLWGLGIHVEIVRTRPECVVLRCRPRAGVPRAPAIELTKGVVETLPLVARGAPGTVVESSSSEPTTSTCVMALLWKPADPTQGREGFPRVTEDHSPRAAVPVGAIALGPAVDAGVDAGVDAAVGSHAGASTAQHAPPPDLGVLGDRDEPAALRQLGVPEALPLDDEPPVISTSSPKRRRSSLRRLRSRHPLPFRRAWLVALCTCLFGVLAQIAYPHPAPTYTASAVLLVNPGASATSPGSAQEAANLAATYAGLIPSDDAIVRTVVAATGLGASQVEHDVAVSVQDGTSLLVISFTAGSSASALSGANAMARALSAPRPVSAAIPAGTVVVTKQATSAVPHVTSGDVLVALGVALGALLGVILALGWERLDPRLDQAPQAAELLGIPTRLIPGLSDLSASAILRQWQAESEMPSPRVAFVGASPGIADQVTDVARRFVLPAGGAGPTAVLTPPSDPGGAGVHEPRSDGHTEEPSIQLLAGGAPGAEAGEVTAQRGDLVVLVIVQETKVRSVKRSVAVLKGLDISPSWALLTARA